MEKQEELEKRRDVVRTWLAEFESNYNKEFLEVVAEIQEADVKKDDKCLIGKMRQAGYEWDGIKRELKKEDKK